MNQAQINCRVAVLQLIFFNTPKNNCFHWRFGFVERLEYLFINLTAWLLSSHYAMYKFIAGITRCKLCSNSNYMCNIWIPMRWLHTPLFWHLVCVRQRKYHESLRKGFICSPNHSSLVTRSTKSICGWHGNKDFGRLETCLAAGSKHRLPPSIQKKSWSLFHVARFDETLMKAWDTYIMNLNLPEVLQCYTCIAFQIIFDRLMKALIKKM